MAQETRVQSQLESYQRLKKWYLMPPCLTLSIIRLGWRVKWSHPGKGVTLFPIPWCSSYRKGSLQVTLNNFIYIYYHICWLIKNVLKNYLASLRSRVSFASLSNGVLVLQWPLTTDISTNVNEVTIPSSPPKLVILTSTYHHQLFFKVTMFNNSTYWYFI